MDDVALKILHLDDDLILLRIAHRLLTAYGFQTSSLSDPCDLDEVEWSSFALLIIDLVMPRRDGFEVGRVAREARYRGPILFLTSMALSREQMATIGDLNAVYMAKPFGPQDLLSRVRQLLVDPLS